MKSNVMDTLLEMVCDKLEVIAKAGELNGTLASELDTLIDIKKDILEVQAMEEYTNNQNMYMNNNGYSGTPMHGYNSYDNGMNGNSMNGNSYSRGYVIHPYDTDRMRGGYGWDQSYGRMNSGYSRDDAEQDIMNKLHAMAQNTTPEKREMINKFMSEMERA